MFQIRSIEPIDPQDALQSILVRHCTVFQILIRPQDFSSSEPYGVFTPESLFQSLESWLGTEFEHLPEILILRLSI